jgi:hypothetical protein
MAGIFSTRFAEALGPTAGSYTVPSGKTAVLRSIQAFNAGSASGNWSVQLEPNGAFIAGGLLGAYLSAGPPAYTANVDLRTVLQGGDGLQLNCTASVWVVASGYLFVA